MRKAVMALTLAGALALAPAAAADAGSASDPRDDLFDAPASGSATFDIVRATFGHKRGQLVHTVSVAGSVASPASLNAPYLLIQEPGGAQDPGNPNGQADCRYFVGRHQGRLGVFTCGYGDRVAGARVTRTSGSTIRFEFSPRAIGNLPAYQWKAVTEGQGRYAARSQIDKLPSGDRTYLTHTLR
jgi:hypothetical protein